MPQMPFVPDELLRALKEAFPDRLPDSPVDPGKLGVLVGEQKVIRFLERHNQDQAERLLKGEGV